MQVVPSGSPLPFEYGAYDYDPSLFVAMKVYDITGAPSLVATTAMTHLFGGSYVASFTPASSKRYLVHKGVYTDGLFTTLDNNRSPAVETFLAIAAASGGSLTPGDIVAIVNAVWDEPQTSHVSAGSFGLYLDSPVSDAGGGSLSSIEAKIDNINANTVPSVIAQDVWNAARSGFAVSGTFGQSLQGILSPARAALIDNLSRLDIVVSTRAQQTTADDVLGDTNYLVANLTSGRIANLDRLDVSVSSRATQVSVDGLPSAASMADAVWDEALAGHTMAGSAGLKLGAISASVPPTVSQIAAGVWNELTSGHSVSGSYGVLLDISVSSRATQASLDDAKGSGFSTSTDSLRQLRAKVDALPTSAGDATAANQTTILSQLGTKASQSSISTLQASVSAIPTNPVLVSDARVARLDVAVSTRASQAGLDDAKGAGFVSGTDDLHSIKQAVLASVDLSPVLADLTLIKGSGFSSATDGLAANKAAVAASTAAANAAASSAAAAAATAATRSSQASVSAVQATVNAIPTNPALASDPRLSYLDANVSSRADAVTLGQILGSGFNPATDSLHAIKILVAALAPGDATAASQIAILAAVSTLATAAGLNSVAAAISAIPVNPLLTGDSRLARLDVAVSSRATDADMQLVKGTGFTAGVDDLHAIKQAVPPAFNISSVMAELARIEGAGFADNVDDLKHANDKAKDDRRLIYADTQALLSSGEPF